MALLALLPAAAGMACAYQAESATREPADEHPLADERQTDEALAGAPITTPGAVEEPMPTTTGNAAATPTPLLGGFVVTRAPEPTATPGAVAREVEKMVARAGLAWTRILGLTIAEWTTLGTSLLAVLVAYLVGRIPVEAVAWRSQSRGCTLLSAV
jgi:hypothetical protein